MWWNCFKKCKRPNEQQARQQYTDEWQMLEYSEANHTWPFKEAQSDQRHQLGGVLMISGCYTVVCLDPRTGILASYWIYKWFELHIVTVMNKFGDDATENMRKECCPEKCVCGESNTGQGINNKDRIFPLSSPSLLSPPCNLYTSKCGYMVVLLRKQ